MRHDPLLKVAVLQRAECRRNNLLISIAPIAGISPSLLRWRHLAQSLFKASIEFVQRGTPRVDLLHFKIPLRLYARLPVSNLHLLGQNLLPPFLEKDYLLVEICPARIDFSSTFVQYR